MLKSTRKGGSDWLLKIKIFLHKKTLLISFHFYFLSLVFFNCLPLSRVAI